MKPNLSVLACLFTVLGLIVFAHADESVDAGKWDPGTWLSYIGEAKFESKLSREAVIASPDWTLDQSPPLAMSEAVILARQELAKHTDDAASWQVTDLECARLNDTPTKWFYVVSFQRSPTDPKNQSEVRIPVSFNRQVAALAPQLTTNKP